MNGEAKHGPSMQWNVIQPKRKGILAQATARMKLEGITLSDISQTQKNK